MATEQIAADQKKSGMLGERDAGGHVYTSMGSCDFYTSQTAPDHAARKGSLCVNVVAAKMYICTVAAGTWVLVGTIES